MTVSLEPLAGTGAGGIDSIEMFHAVFSLAACRALRAAGSSVQRKRQGDVPCLSGRARRG